MCIRRETVSGSESMTSRSATSMQRSSSSRRPETAGLWDTGGLSHRPRWQHSPHDRPWRRRAVLRHDWPRRWPRRIVGIPAPGRDGVVHWVADPEPAEIQRVDAGGNSSECRAPDEHSDVCQVCVRREAVSRSWRRHRRRARRIAIVSVADGSGFKFPIPNSNDPPLESSCRRDSTKSGSTRGNQQSNDTRSVEIDLGVNPVGHA